MGPNTVTATRIHKGGETHRLAYELFPHMGMLKTYCADKMVPDSASTSTALLTGVKANYNTVGVDATVARGNCSASLDPDARVESLAALALKAGKRAGFVTTMRVTHATPSPMYAHSAARQWECDAAIPLGSEDCKDIGRQLVEDWPGRDLHVILGGGRQSLIQNATGTPSDPISAWACSRRDGRNLIQEYIKNKQTSNLNYKVVSTTGELESVGSETDYLLGIFSNAHLPYEFERQTGPEGSPSIAEMTEAAIKVLQKGEKGFFLMVAVNMTDDKDTLIVVTADHTHTMTINGYPERGSPSKHDGINYTAIAYGTGGPGSIKYDVREIDSKATLVRRSPDEEDTTSFTYEQIAAIPLDENRPHAHLFHTVHEQNYVFYVISYAAKLGVFSAAPTLTSHIIIYIIALLLVILSIY
ncbi:unnamed protein product [Leptidea sinapis]|nr:unnamed protein product [Leptidea sinapis]